MPWRKRQDGRGARARCVDRVTGVIERSLRRGFSLAVSLWSLIGVLLVSVILHVSALPSRSLSPGYMEQAPSRGHEASPQSGLGVGCKLCSISKKLRNVAKILISDLWWCRPTFVETEDVSLPRA